MSDLCLRCGGMEEVTTRTMSHGTAYICLRCGKQTDFDWNEDDEEQYYRDLEIDDQQSWEGK